MLIQLFTGFESPSKPRLSSSFNSHFEYNNTTAIKSTLCWGEIDPNGMEEFEDDDDEFNSSFMSHHEEINFDGEEDISVFKMIEDPKVEEK
jgi:hypothetical protein